MPLNIFSLIHNKNSPPNGVAISAVSLPHSLTFISLVIFMNFFEIYFLILCVCVVVVVVVGCFAFVYVYAAH